MPISFKLAVGKAGLKMPNAQNPSFPDNHEFLCFGPKFNFCLKRMFIKCDLAHRTFFIQSNTVLVENRIEIHLSGL